MSKHHNDSQHERVGVPAELSDASRGIRIQKAIADAGLASRRSCEQLIEEGRVRVNGKLVTALPAWVNPDTDKVTVDGRPVPMGSTFGGGERKVYILLNKPRNVISTVEDPEGRRTVVDLIDMDNAPRLFPVGRLDADSTGLIILTNDGDLTQRLTHPSYGVVKEYHVAIRGRLTEDDIARLKKGVFLSTEEDGRGRPGAKRARATDVKLLGYGRGTAGDRTRLSIKLQEGQNREIRRLMARLGYNVRRLQRVAIGPLRVKGIGVGQWRMLTKAEVDRLYKVTKSPSDSEAAPRSAPRPQRSTGGPSRPHKPFTPRNDSGSGGPRGGGGGGRKFGSGGGGSRKPSGPRGGGGRGGTGGSGGRGKSGGRGGPKRSR